MLVGSGVFPSHLPSPLPVQRGKDLPAGGHLQVAKHGIQPGEGHHCANHKENHGLSNSSSAANCISISFLILETGTGTVALT